MRGRDRRNGWVRRIVGASPVLFLGLSATADSTAPAASGWDASHMRSNFANYLREPATRPPILGATRFVASDTETPTTTVMEQTLTLSPHGWQPGGPSGGSSSRTRLGGSTTFTSTHDARAQRGSVGRRASSSSSAMRHR